MTAADRERSEISSIGSMWSAMRSARHDPAARRLNVDLIAVLIAVLLPWSTSGVSIGVVLWLAALAATLEWRPFLRSLQRPICALPIALVALAALGTLWSDAPWGARIHALSPVTKLLALPFLFYHFERSTRGMWIFVGFLVSCALLMLMSWIVALVPAFTLKPPGDRVCGVFVKNYIDQSQEFALCALALVYPLMTLLRENRRLLAMLFAAIALGFIFNMVFVIASRTALVTMPILLAVFALRHLRWRDIAMLAAVTVIAGLAWAWAPRMCRTVETISRDFVLYQEQNAPTSAGLRMEYWTKSLRFIREAPFIGHGTGSIRGLFERAAVGGADLASGQVVANPHNQTLSVAIQWGIPGVIVLYAMWLCHLALFRGGGLTAWIGLLVAVQNILSSLFNSHIFDFHEGWMYVLGVGIAGGMVLRDRSGGETGEPGGSVRS